MSLVPALYQTANDVGAAGIAYGISVATAALVSLLSRDKEHRRDARETLKILLRRKS